MNYEEKYKQALENFKKIKSANSDNKELVNFIEYEYPELRESEDERIRKWLIDTIKAVPNDSIEWEKIDKSDVLSWLEKQGEQSIIDLKEYAKGILKGAATHLMIWIDENLADGKMCLSNMECKDLEDAMVNAKWDKIYKYIKKKVEKQGEQSSWSKEDEKMLDSIIDCLDGTGLLDFDQIDWLKTLKDRVQPKKDWSEEDEKTWKELIEEVKDQLDSIPWPEYRNKEDYKVEKQLNKWLNWLKSIKPNHWKPSKEQMEALLYALGKGGTYNHEALTQLYNNLKNL